MVARKSFLMLLLIVSVFLRCIPCVTAANKGCSAQEAAVVHWHVPYISVIDTGFTTEDVSAERKDKIVQEINLQFLTVEPDVVSIVCFDVNEDHAPVIGYSKIDRRATVCIYSQDGAFQYGYSFTVYGSYYIEWIKENLLVYLVRSDLSIEITPTGDIVAIRKIIDTEENHTYWYDIQSTGRLVGDTMYRLKNDMGHLLNFFASSYSQVIAIDKNGEEVLIIDHNAEQTMKYVVRVTSIILFVSGVVIVITVKAVKAKKGRGRLHKKM